MDANTLPDFFRASHARWATKQELDALLFAHEMPRGLQWEEGDVLIYALADPRNTTVRYVGVTNDRQRRHSQHRRGVAANLELSRWELRLSAAGYEPMMVTLGYAEGWRWKLAERNWIAWFISNGFCLYNKHPGGSWNPDRPWPSWKSVKRRVAKLSPESGVNSGNRSQRVAKAARRSLDRLKKSRP